jgi:Uma2 family endonuclease
MPKEPLPLTADPRCFHSGFAGFVLSFFLMALEAPTAPTRETLLDRWQEIIIVQHPELFEDRAERVETDAYGNILISPPPAGEHQKQAFRITALLETLLPGDGTVLERSVLTDRGIKIPDVIWLPPERAHEISGTRPLGPAPHIYKG